MLRMRSDGKCDQLDARALFQLMRAQEVPDAAAASFGPDCAVGWRS